MEFEDCVTLFQYPCHEGLAFHFLVSVGDSFTVAGSNWSHPVMYISIQVVSLCACVYSSAHGPSGSSWPPRARQGLSARNDWGVGRTQPAQRTTAADFLPFLTPNSSLSILSLWTLLCPCSVAVKNCYSSCSFHDPLALSVLSRSGRLFQVLEVCFLTVQNMHWLVCPCFNSAII